MSRASHTIYARLWTVASSFYDGATGNRCFKLETITVSWIGGRRAHRVYYRFLYVAIYSRGKRGWIIECTAAFTIISPFFLIRKHAARAVCATGMSLIFPSHLSPLPSHLRWFLYRWIVLRKRTSSVEIGCRRCFSVLNEGGVERSVGSFRWFRFLSGFREARFGIYQSGLRSFTIRFTTSVLQSKSRNDDVLGTPR